MKRVLADYPWFRAVPGTELLQQGDLLQNCPIWIPPRRVEPGGEVCVAVAEYNVLILSQSCDLAQDKIDLVLVCPVWSLTEMGAKHEMFRGRDGKERLRRGEVVGYHLINRCEEPGFEAGFRVADFRATYSVDVHFAREFA